MRTLNIEQLLNTPKGAIVKVYEATIGKFVGWIECFDFMCVENDGETVSFIELENRQRDCYKAKGLGILHEGSFTLIRSQLEKDGKNETLYSKYNTEITIKSHLEDTNESSQTIPTKPC